MMKSFALLPLVLFSMSVSNSESRRLRTAQYLGCELMKCAEGERCVEEVINCVTAPCPDPQPECIKDSCLRTKCNDFSTCELDKNGVPSCVPLASCSTVRCGGGTTCIETPTGPQCLATDCQNTECGAGQLCIDDRGSPTCIEDPCTTLRCQEGTACKVAKDGTADCAPIYTTQLTCDNVRCNIACVETEDGPLCVNDITYQVWFDELSSKFMGTNLKRCTRRNIPPANGIRCGETAKTCFFGTQDCGDEIGPHPDTRCFCSGQHGDQTWHCKPAACPELPSDFIK